MRRSDDFRVTVRRGARAGAGTLTVHLDAPRHGDPTAVDRPAVGQPQAPTVGFVVSRAVGTAVVRNRVRRRLRHLLADRVACLPAGARLVVRASPEAAAADSGRLGRDLDRALARALDRAAPAGGARGAGR
jgi:ribonuclease P protein component